METRLRLKRKETEKEAAALQSQIVTRSTAKKARAIGISAPLFQEHKEIQTPVSIERSRRRTSVDRTEGHEYPQARRRATPRPTTRQQTAATNASNRGQQARPSAPLQTGAPEIQSRHTEAAPKEEANLVENEMERQRKGDNDEEHGRGGADDEVLGLLGLTRPAFCVYAASDPIYALPMGMISSYCDASTSWQFLVKVVCQKSRIGNACRSHRALVPK